MTRTKQMARRNRNRGGRRGDRNNEGGDRRGNYQLTERKNEMFEKYYKLQNLIPEEEFDDFLATMRRPLPATFRVTGYTSQAHELLKIIRGEYLANLMNIEVDGAKVDPPKCLSWYPGELAWQLSLDRKIIRHNSQLKKLHEFLISETESGNISRQEAVSMIPPLLMDIKSHHNVLDMCAAPGSKTAQLIEILHSDEKKRVPEGMVVANDADNKRCYLMVHQVKRLESGNFVVINHDASRLPRIRMSPESQETPEWLSYDRILADVPCSGDGTMRKNPDVWFKWSTTNAHALHGLQARILKKGVMQLKVGGRLVYSTCSLNPIEDEAVVADIIKGSEGSLELVDASSEVPGLKYKNGVSSWKVMTKTGEIYEKFEDVPKHLQTQIRPSMFPPEQVEELNLNKCMRILPHHQDTGGFFVAVIHKTREVPYVRAGRVFEKSDEIDTKGNEALEQKKIGDHDQTDKQENTNDQEATPEEKDNQEKMDDDVTAASTATEPKNEAAEDDSGKDANEEVSMTSDGDEKAGGSKRKCDEDLPQERGQKRGKFQGRGYKEDPFIFLNKEDPIWPPIQKFFEISDNFPVDQLMVRSADGKKRHLYFTSKGIATVLRENHGRIKFVNTGLKVFSRSESPYTKCDFRLVQDGINMLEEHLSSDRRIHIIKEDIITILSQENPFLFKLKSNTQDQLRLIDQGGMYFTYDPEDDDREDSPKCRIVLCGWLGKTSCRSFLPKFERSHYLRLCGHELKTKEDKLAEVKSSEEKSTEEKVGDETEKGKEMETQDGASEQNSNGQEDDSQKPTEIKKETIEKKEEIEIKMEESTETKDNDSTLKENDSDKAEDICKKEIKSEGEQDNEDTTGNDESKVVLEAIKSEDAKE